MLEHATNGRRIKARFEPKHLLLRRLYGPQAAAAAAAEPAAPRHPSSGLSKQLSMTLLQQHTQLVLQPSRALTGTVSQLLPSPSSAAAVAGSDGAHAHTSKLQEQPPLVTPQQQGLRVATALQQQQQQLTPQASPVLTPTRTAGAPPSPFAQPAAQPGGLGGAGPSGGGGSSSAGGGGSGAQYTPRRSTEVLSEELVTSSGRPESHRRGVSFVRLTKTPNPILAGRSADAPDAVDADISRLPTDQQGAMTAAGPGIISSSGSSLGKAAASGDATAAGTTPPGMLQMVGSGDQRKRQLQAFNMLLLSQQKQHAIEQRHEVAGSSSTVPAGPRAAATASLAPAAAGRGRAHDVVKEEVASEDSIANSLSDPTADIVAHKPVAVPARQSVLGSRKALRRVTAMQLLIEPVVQSLLSKV